MSNASIFDNTALYSIDLYQKYISPKKGYRCAYSALHGGCGCSGHVKILIKKHGVLKSIPLARNRFKMCREAYSFIEKHGIPGLPPGKHGANTGGICGDCERCL